jgi:cell division transport system ATP-binding protein
LSFESDTVIAAESLKIYQESNLVLSNVNFTIHKGEFVYLVGKTGSGKSSLLKTLYADLNLVDGNAEIAGFGLKNIKTSKIPYLRRKIGIIFQDFQLLSDRTVNDNLTFVMKATGWSSKVKIRNRITEVLMQVGLASAVGKFPHQLSGGEQQRIAIARALINEPVVLLADEPTGNLDPEVAQSIMELFIDINKAGTAVLMATHNHDFIKKFPARVLKCESGELLDIPSKIY